MDESFSVPDFNCRPRQGAPTTPRLHQSVGDELRKLRQDRGVSIEFVVRRLGWPLYRMAQLAAYEQGTAKPDAEEDAAIRRVLEELPHGNSGPRVVYACRR